MFFETAIIFVIFAVILTLLSFVYRRNADDIWKLVFICIAIGIVFLGIYAVDWKHETKNITIEDKFILQTSKVVVANGTSYYVSSNVDYSNLKINQTYMVNIGYQDDVKFFPIIYNIDSIGGHL